MALSKQFHEYIIFPSSEIGFTHSDYLKHPATAFLRFTIEAKDAIVYCRKYFPKTKKIKIYNKNSRDALEHLTISMLPAIMGHFETYQKYLFARAFDLSIFLKNKPDIDKFITSHSITIDPQRLATYRQYGANSIGLLFSDSLPSWHNPDKVNMYFQLFKDSQGKPKNFYDNADKEQLKILWQLRHSIVHTGGTLSLADSYKVDILNSFGNRQLVFEETFIPDLCRRFHMLIKKSTFQIDQIFQDAILDNISNEIRKEIRDLFEVSGNKSWLK